MKKKILILAFGLIFIITLILLLTNYLNRNKKLEQDPLDNKIIQKEREIDNDFSLLDNVISKGTRKTIKLVIGENYIGDNIEIPITVVNGIKTGKIVCLVGGIHGDELNGILIVKNLLNRLDPKKINGTIVGIPVVNLPGFRRGSRYLPDRRDLNRFFPGTPDGSMASRYAYKLFNHVIKKCDCLVDFHTASSLRSNFPQVRADLNNKKVKELAFHFGAPVIIHKTGSKSSLRRVAVNSNIPAITYETGLPLRFQTKNIEQGLKSTMNLLAYLEILPEKNEIIKTNIIYHKTKWLRTDHGGILINNTELGAYVKEGQILASVLDPITDEIKLIKSKYSGHIIGKSISKLVMPGYAIFHIGTQKSILEDRNNYFEENKNGLELKDYLH